MEVEITTVYETILVCVCDTLASFFTVILTYTHTHTIPSSLASSI